MCRAPEQFGPHKQHTIKADLWGFACTLLHMVTGVPPWSQDNMLQICTTVGVRRQSPPLPEGLPGELQQLLAACLAADPGQRPAAQQVLKVSHWTWMHALYVEHG
jgi:serine/threonine protein kinase